MSAAEMAVFGGACQDGNNPSEDGSPLSSSAASNGQLGSPANSDDLMEPVERLEKYSLSDVIFHRYVCRARLRSHAVRFVSQCVCVCVRMYVWARAARRRRGRGSC